MDYSYQVNGPGFVLGIVVFVLVMGLNIFTLVDANKYESWVWERAGQNKVLWQVLFLVLGLLSFCCCLIGLPAPIIYLTVIKKKLDEAQAGGGGGYGGYGYGQPGYPPPGGPGYPPQGPQYPPQGPQYPPGSGGPTYPPSGGPGYPPGSGGPS